MFASLVGNKVVVPFAEDDEKQNVRFVKKGLKDRRIHYRSIEYRRPSLLSDFAKPADEEEEFGMPVVVISF